MTEGYVIKGISSTGLIGYFYQLYEINEPLMIPSEGLDLSVPNAIFGDDPKKAQLFATEKQALNNLIMIHDGSKLLKIERKM